MPGSVRGQTMALTNGEFGRPFVPHPQHDNILVAHGWQAGMISR